MYKSILFFFLLQLTLLARYLVYGAFEPLTYVSTFLLPISGVVIHVISKKTVHKELNYQPKEVVGWSFYHLQRSVLNSKPLFKGQEQRGQIHRYFEKKWQHVIADIFGFNWYLALSIQIDQDTYTVRWNRVKRFSQQEHWKIHKNGQQIGEARTLINLQNTAKLKEVIEFSFGDTIFISSATTVSSTISLSQNNELVGQMKRNHLVSNVQVLDVKEDSPEYLIALITHSFYFKNS